jgi:mannose-1-phosphate guanylyltransferase
MAAFFHSLQIAIDVATHEKTLVTIGTTPNYPNVQFGYIKKGSPIEGQESVFRVEEFREKPDLKTAKAFVSSGRYLWNTGLYVWEVNTLLGLFKQNAPDMYQDLVTLRAEYGGKEYNRVLHDWYSHVKREAFDKAISEKADKIHVVEAHYQWNDIGNWKTVYDLSEKDENGNVILSADHSHLITLDAHNCLVMPKQKTVSLLGVSDLIVVQTRDTLLICHKDHVHNVKFASREAEKQTHENTQ